MTLPSVTRKMRPKPGSHATWWVLVTNKVGILNYFPSFPSLRRRRNLTSVSTFCKAAPVSLFWAHNGLNELPEMHFEFPSILIDKSTMAFLTGQSKSWYTGGDPEQGFRHCFADGVNQRLISSSAQATLPHAQPHTQFFSPREREWREKTLPLSTGRALGTRLPYVTVSFLAESSPLLSCAYTRTSYTYWKVLYVKECDS